MDSIHINLGDDEDVTIILSVTSTICFFSTIMSLPSNTVVLRSYAILQVGSPISQFSPHPCRT